MLFKCLRLQRSILDTLQHPPPLKYLGCDSNRAQRKSYSADEYGISSLNAKVKWASDVIFALGGYFYLQISLGGVYRRMSNYGSWKLQNKLFYFK